MTMRVLIADDDPNVMEIVRLYFEQQQMELQEAQDGKQALQLVRTDAPDIVILDVMMPEMDGYETCREIRKISAVPIIMLTAKGEEIDRILGLELGADDYVTKPFSPRELVARIKAIFRRMDREPWNQLPEQGGTNGYHYGGLVIDLDKREVTAEGTNVILRPKEFDLLAYMAGAPGIVHTREQLLEHVWGYDFIGDIRTVDVHVKKVRNKLGDMQHCIQTVWGVGYKFEVENECSK